MTNAPESLGPGEAARAAQRKLEWLSIDVQKADIGDVLERAKAELATLIDEQIDPVRARALLRAGDMLAMACALDSESAAVAFIQNLMDNILGIEADAERGRIMLRPRLPDDWKDVVVRNIRIGDAAITMHYQEDGNVRRFTLSQTSGAYPIRLIFEAALVPPVRFAFVDGALATLDSRPVDNRIVMPVQIMLDDTRVVEFQNE